MTVIYRPPGNWFVFDGDLLVATFHSSEQAWAYVDRHSCDKAVEHKPT